MPTAHKLPSGSWRCQVCLGKDPATGKKIVRSATAPTNLVIRRIRRKNDA